MRTRIPVAVLAGIAGLVITGVAGGTAAQAKDRPCGRGASTSGVGTKGTAWKLKSMYG